MQLGPKPLQMFKTDPCRPRGSALSIREMATISGRRRRELGEWGGSSSVTAAGRCCLPSPLGTLCHSLAMQGSHRQGAPWKDKALPLQGRCPTFVPGKGVVGHKKNAQPEGAGAPT